MIFEYVFSMIKDRMASEFLYCSVLVSPRCSNWSTVVRIENRLKASPRTELDYRFALGVGGIYLSSTGLMRILCKKG